VVNIGPDQSSCAAVTFAAGGGFSSYLWSTGATGSSISTSIPGTYWVVVTDSIGCTGGDSAVLTMAPEPVVNLGGDIGSCVNAPFTLSVPGGYDAYLWSTGGNTSSIVVNTPGDYWVQVTDSLGCVGGDSIEYFIPASPIIDLGPDVVSCDTSGVTLGVSGSFSSYLWSTGDSSAALTTSNYGIYWLQVTDTNGCTGSDTISFDGGEMPQLDLGPDQKFCGQQIRTLQSTLDCPACAYLWENGATTQAITVSQTGTHILTVSNACGSLTDSITISIEEGDGIFIPNVFSPNGDGINDTYFVSVTNKEEFELSIVSRWGQELFYSQEPSQSWNGVFNGAMCPDGIYVFIVRAKACNGENRNYSGTFTLMR
jgi:gliding motility-associated-like protein